MALIREAKTCMQNPTPENRQRVQAEYEKLAQLLKEAREFESTPPGFVEPSYISSQPSVIDDNFNFELMNTENDSDLLKAAKQEVLAAREIYNEALKIAQEDPEKLRQLLALNIDLEEANKRIIEAAKMASKFPDNPEYQNNLQNAQKQLINIVQRITNLTAPSISNDEFDELNSTTDEVFSRNSNLPSAINNVMSMADDVMKRMDQILNLDFLNMSAEDLMKNTNLITKEVKDVANALKEMARNTTNPTLKNALLSGSAIITDNAMKMKILGAVKASQGNDGNDRTLENAILGMKSEMGRIMNDVGALNLQHSVKNTEKQASILKKIANNVRRARNNNNRSLASVVTQRRN